MHFHRMIVGSVLAGVLVVAATGIGQADPSKPAAGLGDVGFNVKKVDNVVITTIDKGVFEMAEDAKSVTIKDVSGKIVDSFPLSYTLDNVRYPVKQEISADKHTLKLTPVTDRAKATPVPAGSVAKTTKVDKPAAGLPKVDQSKSRVHLKPVASDPENALAQQNFMNQLGIASSVGTIVGTIVGAIVGGVVGAGVGLATCALLLACVIVGIPIFVGFAVAGGIAGTTLAGGGALLNAGWDYLQTVQAAPGSTPYQVQLDQQNAAAHRAQKPNAQKPK